MQFPDHIQVFIVGGYVRDRLLGREGKDHDFVVVGATPQEMVDLGFQQVGADFPVFLHPLTGDEFALARTERKTGSGYNGFETTFDPTVTLDDDLVRRDLTINAMARKVIEFNDQGHAKLEDDVVDLFGGRDDLRNGVLRHVSEAFAEDPLRVLRVARFAARYDFDVHPDTLQLMKDLVAAGEMEHLTAERVWAEMDKSLQQEQPTKFFWTLQACGAMEVLFPEMGRTLINSGFSVSRAALRNADRMTRFMLLFAWNDWDRTETMLERLKAPNDVQRMVRKFHRLRTALEAGNQRVWDMDAEKMFQLLIDLDVFRRPDDLFEMSAALGHVGGSHMDSRMDTVLVSFRHTRSVTFATLSDEQRDTLEGPAVGEAIDAERLRRIQEVM